MDTNKFRDKLAAGTLYRPELNLTLASVGRRL